MRGRMNVQNSPTWREWLGQRIADPQERKRITKALGVVPLTLTRWVNGGASPRKQTLYRLLDCVPDQREHLLALYQREFPDMVSLIREEEMNPLENPVVPHSFYRRILHTLTTTPQQLIFHAIGDLILQEALKQLDPERKGMSVVVARCMPARPGKGVRSLRECLGRGTAPWPESLNQQMVFLGAESLAGAAVSSGHIRVNQALKKNYGQWPGYYSEWEESAVAAPILRSGCVAGCLSVASVLPDYFVSQRLDLIEQYAELLQLIFTPDEFIEIEQCHLQVMPQASYQSDILATFRHRLYELMRANVQVKQPLSLLEIEQAVWQLLEEELLERPAMPGE